MAECPIGAACCAPYSVTFSSRGIASGCSPNEISSTHVLLVVHSQDLGDFRDKYLYVLTTIPDADFPKPSTLFNHLIDELDKCPTLKQKVEKARESKPGSHRRTTEWLWNGVDIALELHQQKINRQEFDRTLKGKPQVLSSNTQLPKGGDSNAAPAPSNNHCSSSSEREEEEKIKRKRRTIRKYQPLLQKEKAKVAKARETLHQELPQDVAPRAGGEEAVATLLRGQSRPGVPAR